MDARVAYRFTVSDRGCAGILHSDDHRECPACPRCRAVISARLALRAASPPGAEDATPSEPWRAFLGRLAPRLALGPGGLVAPWVEYLLTSRFELVRRFLEGIREPFLADTAPLRARLVDAFRGERVPNRGIRLALNTVDANTGQVVRFVTAPVLPSPEYVVVDAITVDMVLASASIPLLFPPVQI